MFDRTNTDRALPHLPCPEIDYDMLLRIAGYPVKENFVLKRAEVLEAGFQPQEHLRRLAPAGQDVRGWRRRRSIPWACKSPDNAAGSGACWCATVPWSVSNTGLGPADRVRYHLNSQHVFVAGRRALFGRTVGSIRPSADRRRVGQSWQSRRQRPVSPVRRFSLVNGQPNRGKNLCDSVD